MLPEVFKFEQKVVRTLLIDNEPWWVAKDVCDILKIKNQYSSLALLEEDEKGLHTMEGPGGRQDMTIINEPGLYSLVMRSRVPEAKAFKRWITHEVLPSIRKTGQYSAAPAIEVPKTLAQALALAAKLEEQREKLALTLQEVAPKVRFADDMMKCDDGIKVRDAAKVLNTGEKRLYAWLKENKYIINEYGNNVPYQRWIDQGLFRVAEKLHKDVHGNERTYRLTLVTTKGLKYLNEKLNPKEVA